VAIVEDQSSVRKELERQIDQAQDLLRIASTASAEEALTLLPDQLPDVIVMDIQLPGIDGIECVRRLRTQLPLCQFLMLTAFSDDHRLFASLKAGATGYLDRKTHLEQIPDSIRELHAGGSVMSPSIARKLILTFASQESGPDPLTALTPRERNVLHHLSRGLVYKEIGQLLGVSTHTVRTHVHRIYRKLHLHSKAEAMSRFGPPAQPQ
jgi:DNA-binding NarL/FixJ family response regulator